MHHSWALRPFKCSTYLCRGTDWDPRSLTSPQKMVCVQSHAPATMYFYALHEWMFFSLSVIFGTSSLLFCYAQRPVISLSWFIQQFDAVQVTTFERLCERGLIHSAKRCSHNDHLNGSVLSKRMFLLWTPLATDLWNGFKSASQNTDLLHGWAQYILLLKWTKLQLSIYDAMPMVYRFFQPVLHFSSERALRAPTKETFGKNNKHNA
jgi:hypothetical protein